VAIYRTKSGDVLDRICHIHYDGLSGAYEQVLAVNQGLAAKGPVLSAGIEIELPELEPVSSVDNSIDLFG